MNKLLTIKSITDIPRKLLGTPIGDLLEYHNLNRPYDTFDNAKLLVGTCMDNRISINTPKNFSFLIRTGGANMKYSAFHISFAVTVASVSHFALIGHTDCGMKNLEEKKNIIVDKLCKCSSWDKQKAEKHFEESEKVFEIHDEIEFILKQTRDLRLEYPNITIAPMIYKVEDSKLYLIEE